MRRATWLLLVIALASCSRGKGAFFNGRELTRTEFQTAPSAESRRAA